MLEHLKTYLFVTTNGLILQLNTCMCCKCASVCRQPGQLPSHILSTEWSTAEPSYRVAVSHVTSPVFSRLRHGCNVPCRRLCLVGNGM